MWTQRLRWKTCWTRIFFCAEWDWYLKTYDTRLLKCFIVLSSCVFTKTMTSLLCQCTVDMQMANWAIIRGWHPMLRIDDLTHTLNDVRLLRVKSLMRASSAYPCPGERIYRRVPPKPPPPPNCTDTYLTGTWARLCDNMNLSVLSKAVYEYH